MVVWYSILAVLFAVNGIGGFLNLSGMEQWVSWVWVAIGANFAAMAVTEWRKRRKDAGPS